MIILNFTILFTCFTLATITSFLFFFVYLRHRMPIWIKSFFLSVVCNLLLLSDIIEILTRLTNLDTAVTESIFFFARMPLYGLLFYTMVQFYNVLLYNKVPRNTRRMSLALLIIPGLAYLFLFNYTTFNKFTLLYSAMLMAILTVFMVKDIRVILKMGNDIKKKILIGFFVIAFVSCLILGLSMVFFTDSQLHVTTYYEYLAYIAFNIANIYLMTSYFGRTVTDGERLVKYFHNFDQFKLTDKERAIVKLIQNGKSNKEIAAETGVVENTIKTHIYNIYNKLQVKNRVELVNKLQSGTSSPHSKKM